MPYHIKDAERAKLTIRVQYDLVISSSAAAFVHRYNEFPLQQEAFRLGLNVYIDPTKLDSSQSCLLGHEEIGETYSKLARF